MVTTSVLLEDLRLRRRALQVLVQVREARHLLDVFVDDPVEAQEGALQRAEEQHAKGHGRHGARGAQAVPREVPGDERQELEQLSAPG
jgi:hypothetical protein